MAHLRLKRFSALSIDSLYFSWISEIYIFPPSEVPGYLQDTLRAIKSYGFTLIIIQIPPKLVKRNVVPRPEII